MVMVLYVSLLALSIADSAPGDSLVTTDTVFKALLTAFAAILICACATHPPATSYDGLTLVPDTAFGEVYHRRR